MFAISRLDRSFARTVFLLSTFTIAPLLSVHDAGAVGTRTFVLDTLDKMSGGDLNGVSISSDGTVRAGFTLGTARIPDATTVFSALTLADGSTLIGTSPGGKIYKATGD